MVLFDKAEEYYHRYLKSSIAEDEKNLALIHDQLATLAAIRGDFKLAENHWKSSTDIFVNVNPQLDN
ncbi:unnamed protein product, partial [Rotaria sp. Silwood1]